MIYSYLTYCIEVWGNASNVYMDPLFKIQKKAVRIIVTAPYRSPSDPIFRELQILKLSQIHLHRTLIFVFKFLKNQLPNVFNGFFTKNSDNSVRETRQNDQLYFPTCRTTLHQKSFRIWGAKEWNSKASFLDRNFSYHSFNKLLKKTITDKNY